ncbi:MAG: DUF1839 family protein [Betaproteobacteria bacterium]|nr:DUF1839 family protein [Betaproteobacteria bacterium]
MDDIEALKLTGIDAYHAYAFSHLRQLGSGAELLASQMAWLDAEGLGDFSVAAGDMLSLSNATKTLLMKAARAVVIKRPADLGAMIDEIAEHWQSAMENLESGTELMSHLAVDGRGSCFWLSGHLSPWRLVKRIHQPNWLV